jgi:hypothetical protein
MIYVLDLANSNPLSLGDPAQPLHSLLAITWSERPRPVYVAKPTKLFVRAKQEQSNEAFSLRLPVRVGIVDAVATAHSVPLTVAAGRTGRDVTRRLHLDLVVTVGAVVGAG